MKSLPHFGSDAKLDNRGFYFIAQSEQTDLDLDEYGSTIVSYDYVCRQISALGARLLAYEEGVWYGHQDVYVLRFRLEIRRGLKDAEFLVGFSSGFSRLAWAVGFSVVMISSR
jgi:hypothetical protein